MLSLQSLSDNQLALLGCAAALCVAAAMAWASFHLGRSARRRVQPSDRTDADALPFSQRDGDDRGQEHEPRRKAA